MYKMRSLPLIRLSPTLLFTRIDKASRLLAGAVTITVIESISFLKMLGALSHVGVI
jgi:hypothetical protein